MTHAGLVFPRDGRRHPWAAAITFVDSDSGRVVETTVAETYGEGINANHGSRGTLIENNRVFAARAVGIYADAAPDTTIRHNIVVGTANSKFWRSGDSVGAGIAINNEKYHYPSGGGRLTTDIQSKGVKIEGNLVVYTAVGIALWSALPETSYDNLIVTGNTWSITAGSSPGWPRRPPAACSPITFCSASATARPTSIHRTSRGSRLGTTISARAIPEASFVTPATGTTASR